LRKPGETVIYLKSLAVGFIAIVFAVILTVMAMIAFLMFKGRDLPPNQTYNWDPISFFRSSHITWTLLFLAFLLGFTWEYRRVLARQ
jgi:preprotein translocase subunit SecY